ncbi:isoprenoid synthase domain-containing protein [Apiospora marii]|uniref:Isoprenoid synthase domain-containing protein n=1 Tax=Apiospora marii TaxID=335849 RepID=A0ABR1RIE2_9PEZI
MGDWQPDPLPTPPLKGETPDPKESSDAECQDLTGMKTKIRGLVSQFLDGIGYSGPATGDDFDGLLRGVHEQARDLGVPQPEGSKSRYFFIVGLHYARVCFTIPPVSNVIRV